VTLGRRHGLVLVLVLLLAAAGCSVPVEKSARVQGDDDVPFRLLDRDAPPFLAPPDETSADAELCFVAGRRLVPVRRPVAGTGSALDAVRALASPPEDQPGLSTAITTNALVEDVSVSGGVARVELGRSVSASASDSQLLLVAQVVCTLTARPGVGQVTFRLDGAPVQVPTADGSIAPGAVTRDDFVDMIG